MKNQKPYSQALSSRIPATASSVDDLVKAIKDDHSDLKKFMKVMKDDDAQFDRKKEAADGFVSLLQSHAPSEEKALYQICVKVKELQKMTDEAFIEHAVATNLMKTLPKPAERAKWEAQVKVLAELVEHHIEEEESKFLPKVEKAFGERKKEKMAHEFVALRQRSQRNPTPANAGVLGIHP